MDPFQRDIQQIQLATGQRIGEWSLGKKEIRERAYVVRVLALSPEHHPLVCLADNDWRSHKVIDLESGQALYTLDLVRWRIASFHEERVLLEHNETNRIKVIDLLSGHTVREMDWV